MHFFKLYSEFLKSNPAINSHTLPISPTIESLFKDGVFTTRTSSSRWIAPPSGHFLTPKKKLPRLYTDNKAAISCYRKYLIQLDARFAPHVKVRVPRTPCKCVAH